MTFRRPEAGQAGFTLPEALVSLAVMGMAAVLLSAGIGAMGISSARARRDQNQIDGIANAQFTLRERIAAIVPARDPQTGNTLDLAGAAGDLDFIGDCPDRAAPDALQRYRLTLDRSGGLGLYRLSTLGTRVDPHQQGTTGWLAMPLLAGAASLSIHYFGADPLTGGNAWQGDWSHRAVLPSLVRITITFRRGDARVWPDLIVRPRAANGDACRRDIRTGRCADADPGSGRSGPV